MLINRKLKMEAEKIQPEVTNIERDFSATISLPPAVINFKIPIKKPNILMIKSKADNKISTSNTAVMLVLF